MKTTAIYPVISTRDLARTSAFYRELLDLRTTFENEWYVSFATEDDRSLQLAILDGTHDSVPAPYRRDPQGFLVTVEVEDVDEVHARAQRMGLTVVVPLQDEPWGQRHFIALGPEDVLIDVITPIPATPEYAKHYFG